MCELMQYKNRVCLFSCVYIYDVSLKCFLLKGPSQILQNGSSLQKILLKIIF